MSAASEPSAPQPEWQNDTAGLSAEEIVEEVMAGFRRKPGGVSARFTPAQAGIIRSLVSQLAELITPPADEPGVSPGTPLTPELAELAAMLGDPGPSHPPDDPVLARLLPDAYQDDPEAAGEFRRYTEQELRDGKLAAARTVLATLPAKGGRVRLSASDAEVWLRVLNDVRLGLGVRLGITEDYERDLAGLGDEDPRLAYYQVYDWLTFLQETLVRALW
ncbi:MAG TPA: DUF2017 domain-containing protein [Streptosporangiaceae bacterium]|nr:DUF2017 domain-containing protein [Streptosporangiaceae bacterium]